MVKKTGSDGTAPMIFIAGAQKAGTTFLYNLLTSTPFVQPPRSKESFFMAQPRQTIKKNINSYRELLGMEQASGSKYCIDASTGYLYFPEAARNIKDFFPEVRILIVLRDPLARVYSAYLHHRKKVPAMDQRKFGEIINQIKGPDYETMRGSENESIANGALNGRFVVKHAYRDYLRMKNVLDIDYLPPDPMWALRYFQVSSYSRQVEVYEKLFGDEQLKLIFFEELIAEPVKKTKEVLTFLSRDPADLSDSRLSSVAKNKKRNKTKLPRGDLARWILCLKNINGIGKIFRRSLRIKMLHSALYKDKPELSDDQRRCGREVLKSEYEYWYERKPRLENLWPSY